MDTIRIERLLETLIDEIRDLRGDLEVMRKDLGEISFSAKSITEELDWWSKDKHSFAKQVLKALDRD